MSETHENESDSATTGGASTVQDPFIAPPRVLHPVLLALQPVLGLYANNAGKTSYLDLVRPSAVMVVGSLALWFGLRTVVRDRFRAGLAASILIVAALAGWNLLEYVVEAAAPFVASAPWLGFVIGFVVISAISLGVFGRVYAAQAGIVRSVALLAVIAAGLLAVAGWVLRPAFGAAPAALIAVYAFVIVLCLAVMLRIQCDLPGWTQSLNWFAGVLLALYLLLAIANVWRLTPDAKTPPVVASTTPTPSPEASAKLPDIYLVALEGYASPEVLRRNYGYDAAPFLDAMRAKGFQVAPDGRSNYALSLFSLTACLNMDTLQDSLGGRVKNPNPFAEVFEIYHHNKVYEYLKQKGYSLEVLAPGSEALDPRGNVDTSHKPLRSITEFERVLAKSTVAARAVQLVHYLKHDTPASLRAAFVRERVGFEFGRLTEIAGSAGAGPRFVFANLPIPGGPSFAFDREGNPPKFLRDIADPSGAFAGSTSERKAAYIDQVMYLNGQIEKTADAILKQSKRPAVVLFVSGNGPWFESSDAAGKPTIEERYSSLILGYVPPELGGSTPLFPPSSSLVNLFRITFGRVFGETMPPKPDAAYISTPARPLEFTPLPLSAH